MALRTKIREQIYQLHAGRGGRIPVFPLRGLIHAIENVQGNNVSIPDPIVTTVLVADSDAIDATGTGRLYGCWVKGGTLKTRVDFTDNSKAIASVTVPANGYAEAYFLGGSDGIGVPYGTDLTLSVIEWAGNDAAATTERPDVVVIWGDDALNTDDKNTINTFYG